MYWSTGCHQTGAVLAGEPEANMDQETVGNIVLLAIVTLISVVQNGFFAHKVEHESKTQNGRSFQRTGTLAFERVYTAKWRKAKGKIRVPFSMSTQSVVHHIEHSRVTCRQIGKGISTGDCKKEDIGEGLQRACSHADPP
ncbi:arachidonate 5-lipoxygenase-activating protein isoform X9 [Lynx rufus]|uniref:arachidonate 5-lipoxygenase-activating protein isoform X9 n=1 Tax=Lynx rufus TaxID=61384 RepID=UPI001F122E7D|nr:arachidonate 5-lipoxygenase-activating protein isoform X9 [Lynx rufus]